LATENDINVISAAAAMFSGTPNPLPAASTPYDSGENHNLQVHEVSDTAGVGTTKKFANENLVGTERDILLGDGGNLIPVATYVVRDIGLLAIAGLT